MKKKIFAFDPIALCYMFMFLAVMVILIAAVSTRQPKRESFISRLNQMAHVTPWVWWEPHIPGSEEIYERSKEEEQKARDEALPQEDPRRDPNFTSTI